MMELPMTELPMMELPIAELPIREYDGGALSEAEERAREKLILGMGSSSFGAYLTCPAAALANTWYVQQQL